MFDMFDMFDRVYGLEKKKLRTPLIKSDSSSSLGHHAP
jgi:hypothetical protein